MGDHFDPVNGKLPSEWLRYAIKLSRNLANFAKKLDVSRQTIYDWLDSGIVPPHHCPTIEALTMGKVRCEWLRPDIYRFFKERRDLQ